MAAAVYQSPGVITVEDRPVPQPGPDQILVRVDHCGICGSDIHQLKDGWGLPPGAVAGHEWTGTINAVGQGVSDWVVGERVVGGPSPKCGTCRRCLEGKPSQCENRNSMTGEQSDGAFAEYILCRAAGVLRLPEGLHPRHAALAEPLSVALHGITRSGAQPGDAVMVHDILHERNGSEWRQSVSAYRKLRLSPEWVAGTLAAKGLQVRTEPGLAGMTRLIARSPL